MDWFLKILGIGICCRCKRIFKSDSMSTHVIIDLKTDKVTKGGTFCTEHRPEMMKEFIISDCRFGIVTSDFRYANLIGFNSHDHLERFLRRVTLKGGHGGYELIKASTIKEMFKFNQTNQ